MEREKEEELERDRQCARFFNNEMTFSDKEVREKREKKKKKRKKENIVYVELYVLIFFFFLSRWCCCLRLLLVRDKRKGNYSLKKL